MHAMIGFNICFINFISNLICLLSAIIHIESDKIWHIIELIAAPYIFIFGLLINIIFNINFIIPPIVSAITGIYILPNPYNPPVYNVS